MDDDTPVVLVGVDGSAAGRRALLFAARQTARADGRLVLAHVIDWSPYRSATIEENEQRHRERAREVETAREEILDPAEQDALRLGAEIAGCVVRHGHVAETLMGLAKEHGADHLVVGRTGESRLRTLVFGSTPSHLVQVCTIPVTVVP